MAVKKAGPLGVPEKEKIKKDKNFPGKKNSSMPEEYEEQMNEDIRMIPQPLKKSVEKK
ncbi:MAG: hypothetical protein ACXVPU_14965 [Bacteroidia bacterium]